MCLQSKNSSSVIRMPLRWLGVNDGFAWESSSSAGDVTDLWSDHFRLAHRDAVSPLYAGWPEAGHASLQVCAPSDSMRSIAADVPYKLQTLLCVLNQIAEPTLDFSVLLSNFPLNGTLLIF